MHLSQAGIRIAPQHPRASGVSTVLSKNWDLHDYFHTVVTGDGVTARTLLANREWVDSESCFWVLYADVLTNANLTRMIHFHERSRPAATIGLYQVNHPSRFGIVSFDNQFVVQEFVEKPAIPKSNWAFSGVTIATPELLDAMPQQSRVDLGFDVLPRLAGRMLAYPIEDYLLDVGTMENYRAAQTTWPGFSN